MDMKGMLDSKSDGLMQDSERFQMNSAEKMDQQIDKNIQKRELAKL